MGLASIALAGCYDHHGRSEADAGRDAAAVDAPAAFAERCSLAWVRSIPVNPETLGFVSAVAVDRDQNVVVSFHNFAPFELDGPRLEGGYTLGLSPDNEVRFVRRSDTVWVVPAGERIVQLVYSDASSSWLVSELDGRTGATLRTFGTLIAGRPFYESGAAFVGDTLVLSLSVQGDVSTFGGPTRTYAPWTRLVFALGNGPPRAVAEFVEASVSLIETAGGVQMMVRPAQALCVEGVCSGASSARFAIEADGTTSPIPSAPIDDPSVYTDRWAPLPDGTSFTFYHDLVRWSPPGEALWTTPVSASFSDFGASSRRVVTVFATNGETAQYAGSLSFEVSADPQDLFIEFDVATGTASRWWNITNSGDGRSGLGPSAMASSGRFFAGGIADPVVDICGTRVEEGLFIAAFD